MVVRGGTFAGSELPSLFAGAPVSGQQSQAALEGIGTAASDAISRVALCDEIVHSRCKGEGKWCPTGVLIRPR